METKRLILQSLACALIGSSVTTAHAESVSNADPLAASFRRMLDHAPTTVPLVPPGADTDPLRNAVCVFLWNGDSRSFHLPVGGIRIAELNQTGH